MNDETERETFDHDPIGQPAVSPGMTVGELAQAYGDAGIGAADLNASVRLTAKMFAEDIGVFLGLGGPMVPGGMRRIVSDLIRRGDIDALVTTGATLTHDTIEAIGGAHHHGAAPDRGEAERKHDERLREEGVDRIYNVYLPQEHFGRFEQHLRNEVLADMEGTVAGHELTMTLGEANATVNEREELATDPGIAAAAAEENVPVYCPAIEDSILGLQAWMYWQNHDFALDPLADMAHLNDLAYEETPAGALVVGGGVPKNFVLQGRLVVPEAYRYAVQLTMDPPATGGLSGATLNEARSWGKIAPEGENATVYGDATITFPFLIAAAYEWIETRID